MTVDVRQIVRDELKRVEIADDEHLKESARVAELLKRQCDFHPLTVSAHRGVSCRWKCMQLLTIDEQFDSLALSNVSHLSREREREREGEGEGEMLASAR